MGQYTDIHVLKIKFLEFASIFKLQMLKIHTLSADLKNTVNQRKFINEIKQIHAVYCITSVCFYFKEFYTLIKLLY